MELTVVGEDFVTREIMIRLIRDAGFTFPISQRPVRGSKIKSEAPKYLKIASINNPVFILVDMDTDDCPPVVIIDFFQQKKFPEGFIFRVAVTEAENWLIADREGFARYFKIPIESIPEKKSIKPREVTNVEIPTPYKTSLFLMRELASLSKNSELKRQLTPVGRGASKGMEYNSALIPYIRNAWNPSRASKNSTSLKKAISVINTVKKRLSSFLYKTKKI
jgi:hypothetical protein